MQKFYKITILILAMFSPVVVSAQRLPVPNTPQVSFVDFVTSSFVNYYINGGVQEKLYVITDKPYYSAGDTIYFSAFLVNSIYFARTTDTKFIYVELIDATGNVVSRLRVMGSEGRFYNAIPLSAKVTSGKYTLRAYSKWQTNFDKELLFTRELQIGNYIDDAVITNVKYEFDNSGKVVALVEVTNSTFVPIPDNVVEYSLCINGRTTRPHNLRYLATALSPPSSHADSLPR